MRLDVLALAAHRDDVEQTCGGTLLNVAEAGGVTGILDLTAGEAGTRGSALDRGIEAARAADILRVQWRGTLGLPDGGLEVSRDYKLRIAQVIRETQPRILIVPYPKGRHPDHYTAGTLGYEAAFLAGLKKLTIEGSDAPAFRPHSIVYASLYSNERPSFIVDISRHFEARMESLLAYASQYRDQAEGSTIFPEAADVRARVESLARTYGMMIGVKYGEPFISPTPVKVADLRDLEIDTFTKGGLIAPF